MDHLTDHLMDHTTWHDWGNYRTASFSYDLLPTLFLSRHTFCLKIKTQVIITNQLKEHQVLFIDYILHFRVLYLTTFL